jgi:hypothetical protein
MKKIVIAVAICFVSIVTKAQASFESVKKQKAEIVNTGGRTVMLLESFYNSKIEEQIGKQLTKEQFEIVKSAEEEKEWPSCLINVDDKLKSLITYQIATFDNWQNGEKFDTVAILLVPASENKKFNENCKWEKDIFILIPISDIKIIE